MVVKARRPRKARVVNRVGHPARLAQCGARAFLAQRAGIGGGRQAGVAGEDALEMRRRITGAPRKIGERERFLAALDRGDRRQHRSEEHTSELQSLMRISYAVFCLKKKKKIFNSKHV